MVMLKEKYDNYYRRQPQSGELKTKPFSDDFFQAPGNIFSPPEFPGRNGLGKDSVKSASVAAPYIG